MHVSVGFKCFVTKIHVLRRGIILLLPEICVAAIVNLPNYTRSDKNDAKVSPLRLEFDANRYLNIQVLRSPQFVFVVVFSLEKLCQKNKHRSVHNGEPKV